MTGASCALGAAGIAVVGPGIGAPGVGAFCCIALIRSNSPIGAAGAPDLGPADAPVPVVGGFGPAVGEAGTGGVACKASFSWTTGVSSVERDQPTSGNFFGAAGAGAAFVSFPATGIAPMRGAPLAV